MSNPVLGVDTSIYIILDVLSDTHEVPVISRTKELFDGTENSEIIAEGLRERRKPGPVECRDRA
jgi:hypothetical protein